MDHSLLVRRLEGLGDLLREGERPVHFQGISFEHRRQVFAGDELHGDEPFALRTFVQPVDRGDVGMVQ